MADAVHTLTDGRLAQLVAGLRRWTEEAGSTERAGIHERIQKDLKGLAFSYEDVLSMAHELLERRRTHARDGFHFDVTMDTTQAQAAVTALEERVRSLMAQVDEAVRRLTEAQNKAAKGPRDALDLDSVLQQACANLSRELRNGNTERSESWARVVATLTAARGHVRTAHSVSPSGLKQETLGAEPPSAPSPVLTIPAAEDIDAGASVAIGSDGRARNFRSAVSERLTNAPGPVNVRSRTHDADLPGSVFPGPGSGTWEHLYMQAPRLDRPREGHFSVPASSVAPVVPWLSAVANGTADASSVPSRADIAAFLESFRTEPATPASKPTSSNEMLANAIMERLRHAVFARVLSIPTRDKVLHLAEQLHALAMGTPPAPAAPVGLLADATREQLRAAITSVGEDGTHIHVGKEKALNLVDALHALAMGTASSPRLLKLEAVAKAARDTHLGVDGGQQRLEDALTALDGVR